MCVSENVTEKGQRQRTRETGEKRLKGEVDSLHFLHINQSSICSSYLLDLISLISLALIKAT